MTEIDPFAGAEKAPSLSFADAQPGHSYTGVVTDAPSLVQSKDYNTGDPAFWPDGNPKMSVVVNLDVDGEPRSLWASKPSAMFAALAEAQRKSGIKIVPGVKLRVTFTGVKEHTDPEKLRKKLPPQKLYSVDLKAAEPADVFADAPAASGAVLPGAKPSDGSQWGDAAPPW